MFPGNFCLLQESYQVGPIFGIQIVATPGEQATHAHRILQYFVAPHRAMALLDRPANGMLTGIVGAIKVFPLGSPFQVSPFLS